MKNMYYHKINVINTLTQNHWVLVALAFVAIATVIGMSQYCIRNHRLTKRFGDGPYLLLGVTGAIVMGALLVVESHAGIIQLLDNCLRGNESPLLSVALMPFAALMLGSAFGLGLAIIGDLMSSLRKRSLIKSLRLAAKARHKENPQHIRRGQPVGNPRPGTAHPTRHRAGRNATDHHNYVTRVNAGYGMRQR